MRNEPPEIRRKIWASHSVLLAPNVNKWDLKNIQISVNNADRYKSSNYPRSFIMKEGFKEVRREGFDRFAPKNKTRLPTSNLELQSELFKVKVET